MTGRSKKREKAGSSGSRAVQGSVTAFSRQLFSPSNFHSDPAARKIGTVFLFRFH
jgi:hypothetical protein